MNQYYIKKFKIRNLVQNKKIKKNKYWKTKKITLRVN